MSLIVAARFDTFDEAERVAHQLHADGFAPDHTSIFFVNMPGAHGELPIGGDRVSDPAARKTSYGAWGGAAALGLVGFLVGWVIRGATGAGLWIYLLTIFLGGYIGALLGALISTRWKRPVRQPGAATGRRYAGVMLAVRAEGENATRVAQVLARNGGRDVEEAEGTWRDGQWVDFDPVHSPVLTTRLPAGAH